MVGQRCSSRGTSFGSFLQRSSFSLWRQRLPLHRRTTVGQAPPHTAPQPTSQSIDFPCTTYQIRVCLQECRRQLCPRRSRLGATCLHTTPLLHHSTPCGLASDTRCAQNRPDKESYSIRVLSPAWDNTYPSARLLCLPNQSSIMVHPPRPLLPGREG